MSSTPFVPPASCTDVSANDAAALERRRELLADRRIHKSIRAVLGCRGVAEQDIDDLLQETLIDAWRAPRLPLHDAEEARLYIGGIARFKAIDAARRRAIDAAKRRNDAHDALDEEHPSAPRVAEPPHEAQDYARKLLEQVRMRFSRADWLVRSLVHEDTSEKIAADDGVCAAHVRRSVGEMRAYALEIARGLGQLVAVLFFVAIGLSLWRSPGGDRDRHHPDHEGPTKPAPSDARALRDRAHRECDAGEWRACADDLDEARKLDPAGETPEIVALRRSAAAHLP
jgi:DNA-directed RNA polymerase specialized sigma24 family protein